LHKINFVVGSVIITENGSGGTVGNLKLTNDYQLGITTKALFPKYEEIWTWFTRVLEFSRHLSGSNKLYLVWKRSRRV